jgi:hypothetical protein
VLRSETLRYLLGIASSSIGPRCSDLPTIRLSLISAHLQVDNGADIHCGQALHSKPGRQVNKDKVLLRRDVSGHCSLRLVAPAWRVENQLDQQKARK